MVQTDVGTDQPKRVVEVTEGVSTVLAVVVHEVVPQDDADSHDGMVAPHGAATWIEEKAVVELHANMTTIISRKKMKQNCFSCWLCLLLAVMDFSLLLCCCCCVCRIDFVRRVWHQVCCFLTVSARCLPRESRHRSC